MDNRTDEPLGGVRVRIELPEGGQRTVRTSPTGSIEVHRVGSGTFRIRSDGEGTLAETWHCAGEGGARISTGLPIPLWHGTVLPQASRCHVASLIAHRVRSDETLETLARQYGVEWNRIARFNWGTDKPEDVNKALAVAVGSTRKTADGRNLMFDDSDAPGIVFIPRPLDLRLDTGRTHTVRLHGVEPRIESLESNFALEQTKGLARKFEEDVFVLWMSTHFGADISVEAYRKLRNALLDDFLSPPPILLVEDGLDGHLAGYDNAGRVIRVQRDLAEKAETNNSRTTATLLVALVEEFGHHLDNLLRRDFDGRPEVARGDAPLDEGARYAYALADLQFDKLESCEFGRYTRRGRVRQTTARHRVRYTRPSRRGCLTRSNSETPEGRTHSTSAQDAGTPPSSSATRASRTR